MRTHHDFDPLRFLPAGTDAESGYASFLGSMLDRNDSCIFVADAGSGAESDVQGYVFAALEPLSWKELRGPAGFIHDLAVRDDAQRSGVASGLMEAAIGWLRGQGAPRVVLWTAAQNEAAQRLFHRLGFRETMKELTMEL